MAIQRELEQNQAGLRKMPGTVLKDGAGRTVYTPPQDAREIVRLMSDLERFVTDATLFDADPLIKMALIHHQFESIHPFYDESGQPLAKPRTLLIDSEQLESGEALDDGFRAMAATEIDQFKNEVFQRGGKLADELWAGKQLDDAALLREVERRSTRKPGPR